MARYYQPEGKYCNYCWQENHFADDYGWFYFADYREVERTLQARSKILPKPGCENCYRGSIGRSHTDWHGVGER